MVAELSMTQPLLPDRFDLHDDEDKSIEALNKIYQDTIKQPALFFNSLPVYFNKWVKAKPPYEDGFWHLISYTDSTGKRCFDYDRAPKLTWVRAMIESPEHGELLCWRFEEGDGEIRVYIWHRKEKYVVILQEKLKQKTPQYFLVTSFHVDRDEKYDKKYKQRIK